MLSYVHAYHAGNHADILKHTVLSLVLAHLCKKEKPFTVLDTHAGSGIYSLDDERLVKTGEAEAGIKRLLARISDYERSGEYSEERALLAPYLGAVRPFTDAGQYPGSPLLANSFLRPGDEQILSELHPAAIEELRRNTARCAVKPGVHFRDGYEMLIALTPPKIKRGLCLIDPSFEDTADFAACARAVAKAHKKWQTGIITVWYPLLERRASEIAQLRSVLAQTAAETGVRTADIQLAVKRPAELTGLSALYGSGMFVLNAPYTLADDMAKITPFLERALTSAGKIQNRAAIPL